MKSGGVIGSSKVRGKAFVAGTKVNLVVSGGP
jgi:hypothetical protein